MLAEWTLMRILEARLRVMGIGGRDYVTMGYFVWDEEELAGKLPRVQLAPSFPLQRDSGTVLAMLQRLARMTAPNTFDGLKALRNRYWSFVETGTLPPK